MHIERSRPTAYRVTLHTYELSALIAAARWVVDGAKGELSREARKQLCDVLKGYDEEARRLEQK